MKLATWNVNSVKARHERLLAFLDRERPDVLCLQELKGVDDAFPYDAVRAHGYEAAVYGQKTYNGVAILSRLPLEDVVRGFDDGDEEDPQARLVAATVAGVRVVSAYFPNGAQVGSDKWAYKLAWMERLHAYLGRHAPADPLVLAGDFNVAPDDALDVAFPDVWRGSVLTHDAARAALARLRDRGLEDALRRVVAGPGPYSWWDYRSLGFARNDGLRIDHVYATAPLAVQVVEAGVDRDERKGDKPSDHAPVIVTFAE